MTCCLIERGNCLVCGQRRVLGENLAVAGSGGTAFRCCACIDEHGHTPVAKAPSAKDTKRDASRPKNDWARDEPPARLADVPNGCLVVEPVHLQGAGRSGSFMTVTDPSYHFFTGHAATRVWPAALELARHLMALPPSAGLKAVEIGAGCGLPGIVLAMSGASNRVVLTDVPWVLPLAGYNVEANFAEGDARKPEVAPLRWGSAADAYAVLKAHGAPDLVIAADVVYREDEFDPLLRTIQDLGARDNLLAVVCRDYVVQAFVQRLQGLSWHVRVCSSKGPILVIRVQPPDPPGPQKAPPPALGVSMAASGLLRHYCAPREMKMAIAAPVA